MRDTESRVSISPSGLLIEIETLERGERTGLVLIDRGSWPGLVQLVAAALTERRVAAEVDCIADGAAAETFED